MIRVKWPDGWEPLMVSYHPAKFGGNRHFGSEDVMVSICHVISQDHVIQASCDFIGGEPLIVSPHPAKLGIVILVADVCF